MCKLHSVTVGDTEKSRICDKCNSRRLAGKEYEIEGLQEKVKAMKLKIRYITEEIERRQQDISSKSISNSKISSQIDKSTKQWQNKEKDLKYKLTQERAQNERLDNIAENLKKAVEDSRANVAHIESEFSRYESEMTLSKFESDNIDDENKKLMSEVDQLNLSLKVRAPIFKLNSMTCSQCFAQIMRIHTKGDNASVIDLDEKTSRNVSILHRLSVIRENEGDSLKACNKCIIM
jgi:predicted  nucleic acid-binding Zn-ribbon protein